MFSLYDRAEASLPDWQKKLLDNCMCFLFQNKPKNKQTYTHADIWTRKIPAKSQQTQQSQTQMKWGCDHPSCNRNLINCKLSPNKKKNGRGRGFNGTRTRGLCIRASVLCQLSYEDSYRPIYWVYLIHERNETWNETMWNAEIQTYKISLFNSQLHYSWLIFLGTVFYKPFASQWKLVKAAALDKASKKGEKQVYLLTTRVQ